MSNATYNPKVYRKQGGDELVIADGGKITIESGGLVVPAAGTAAGEGLSPLIWADCPVIQMLVDPTVGILARDDFAIVQATGFPYELSGTNGTFTGVAGVSYGQALLSAVTGTDNNEAQLAYNNDVGGLIGCNATKKWWFETRVKLSQIAAECGTFVGLLQAAASQDALMGDDDMILTAGIDCIGFQIVEATANAAPYWRTMMDLAARAAVSETAALASTNFVKLGMKSVPNAAATVATVTFYVDGVALAGTTTTAATDFPLNQFLQVHFGVKTGKNAAHSLTLDWWQAAQLR
jgi:hypothetical protein